MGIILKEFYSVKNPFLLTEEERLTEENSLLSQLADEDLELILGELNESLISEVDPRNPNAYKPKDPLAGGIKARYPGRFPDTEKPKQKIKPIIKPQQKPDVKQPEQSNVFSDEEMKQRKDEIVPIVQSMPKKEKTALFDLIKKELKKRKEKRQENAELAKIKKQAKAEADAELKKAKDELQRAKAQAKAEADAELKKAKDELQRAKAQAKAEEKERRSLEKIKKQTQQELQKIEVAKQKAIKDEEKNNIEIKPAKTGSLKKIVKNLGKLALAGAVAGTILTTEPDSASPADSTADKPATVQQEPEVQKFSGPVKDKSGFYKVVDPAYDKDPYGDLDDSHTDWQQVTGSTAKIRVIDSKPMPGNKKLTVVLKQTLFGVSKLSGGIYKGQYTRAEPEMMYSIGVFDIKKQEVYTVAPFVDNPDGFELAKVQDTFNKLDKSIKPKKMGSKLDSFDKATVIGLVDDKTKAQFAQDDKDAEGKNALSNFMQQNRSGWDGSYAGSKRYIKNIMNDPKSYEHVSTMIIGSNKNGTYGEVLVTFRGKNAFGATVTNEMILTINSKGDITGHTDKSRIL